MDLFVKLAEHGPWFALSVAILLMLARAAKWLGGKLFDDETGVVPRVVAKHNEFLDRTTASSERMVITMMGHAEQLKAMERKLEAAWSARHSDPDVWDLLFVNNPIPMAMVSRDGTYLNVNQALCHLTGFTSVELKAKTWQQMTPADELPTDSASAEDLAAGNADTYRLKKHLLRKDGTAVAVELHAFRYPRMGQFRHFFSFYFPA